MEQKYKDMLQEGFLTDLLGGMSDSGFDFLKDIAFKIDPTLMSDLDKRKFKMGSNLAKEVAGLTAVFPVLVTEAISLENAILISKAVERKCVSMFQMLFAANQITDVQGAKQYLNRFHKNLTTAVDLSNMNVDDIIEYSNSAEEFFRESEEYTPQQYAAINRAIEAVLEDVKYNRDYDYRLEENINPIPLSSYTIHNVYNEIVATLNEATPKMPEMPPEFDKAEIDLDTAGTTVDLGSYGIPVPDGMKIKGTKVVIKNPNSQQNTMSLKDYIEAINKQVLPTDIKKANEAQPSLMIINFKNPGVNRGGEVLTSTAVIGVKAMLHYVPSGEMMERLAMKNSDKHGLLNFIRATTGEIKFFRDFLFAIDRAKVDAVAKSGKGSNSRIWKMLELRAHKAKLNKSAGRNNANCAAITSIIISSAEADIIKQQYRIDIRKPNTFLSIMKGYNFMMGCIVDEVNEKISFLWDDGSLNFEVLSFSSLEREDSGGMYKKVINLMMAKGR